MLKRFANMRYTFVSSVSRFPPLLPPPHCYSLYVENEIGSGKRRTKGNAINAVFLLRCSEIYVMLTMMSIGRRHTRRHENGKIAIRVGE